LTLHHLIAVGKLPALIDTKEWRVPKDETVLRPPKGYIVSLMAFNEHGFSIPIGRFICAMLFKYGL
jgi:hypothetical protein